MRQPLSAKQMAIATAVVLLAVGSFYGLFQGVSSLWHRQHLRLSIPSVLAGVRAQREVLVGIIEEYKAKFGYYPPMFTSAGPGRGVVNPLCYELLGVRVDSTKGSFSIPSTKHRLSVGVVQRYFNTRSFSNCVAFPNLPPNFLANRAISPLRMTREAELFGVGLNYPDFTPEAFWGDYQFSPWRYTTNPAEHNPGKYDLWAEIDVAGEHFTIGNWSEVK